MFLKYNSLILFTMVYKLRRNIFRNSILGKKFGLSFCFATTFSQSCHEKEFLQKDIQTFVYNT